MRKSNLKQIVAMILLVTIFATSLSGASSVKNNESIQVSLPAHRNSCKIINCDIIEPNFLDDFHTYSELTTELQNIESTYPSISKLYNLGSSVQGRTIWGLKITDNPNIEENEAEVRICGCHHGNEIMSVELPLMLAWYLVDNYGSDPYIEDLVDNREIWIIPMVNPDGREMYTRYNANGVDLNRDYGFMWGGEGGSPAPFSQPETKIIRENALDNNFLVHELRL